MVTLVADYSATGGLRSTSVDRAILECVAAAACHSQESAGFCAGFGVSDYYASHAASSRIFTIDGNWSPGRRFFLCIPAAAARWAANIRQDVAGRCVMAFDYFSVMVNKKFLATDPDGMRPLIL